MIACEIISDKLIGKSTQQEHHKIAAELQAVSDKWDEQEVLTGVRPAEAYDYSFGLVMGKELIYGAPSDKLDDLEGKILVVKVTQ